MSPHRRRRARPARSRRAWTRLSDERLLDLRLRDLDLRIEGTWLWRCVRLLYRELERRGVRLRPHVWLSSEWFAPDGVPGIAIPFYLAHPRLMQLEHRQMLVVEGGSTSSCMRILRHEAGHVVDTAFRLHFKPGWRKTFGRYSLPYPDAYRPRPASRNYVLHLDSWYAQAHPAEDFAETFAVWLTPRSRWRRIYHDWPRALRKLRYVDALMKESVVNRGARVRSTARVDPANLSSTTLREYYREKRKRYSAEWPSVYDRDLNRLFSANDRYRDRPSASGFLRSVRREIRNTVAEWTGVHAYTVDQVLQDLIERCQSRRLRLAVPASEAKNSAVLLLTVHTMSSLRAGTWEVPV
jgi:hypothetical protein